MCDTHVRTQIKSSYFMWGQTVGYHSHHTDHKSCAPKYRSTQEGKCWRHDPGSHSFFSTGWATSINKHLVLRFIMVLALSWPRLCAQESFSFLYSNIISTKPRLWFVALLVGRKWITSFVKQLYLFYQKWNCWRRSVNKVWIQRFWLFKRNWFRFIINSR